MQRGWWSVVVGDIDRFRGKNFALAECLDESSCWRCCGTALGKEIQESERMKDTARTHLGGRPAARRGTKVMKKLARYCMTVETHCERC